MVKMIIGLQIVGLIFGLGMLYLTFLHFKRKEYLKGDFIVWSVVWLFFLFMVMFPSTLYGIMESLMIERTVDFFVIGGFMLFSIIIFQMYVSLKRMQNKVEEVVRKVAMDRAVKGKAK